MLPNKIFLILVTVVLGNISYLKAQNKTVTNDPYQGKSTSSTLDVIHLKSGWILKGKLVSTTGDTLKIRTEGDNLFTFPASELLFISQEKIKENPLIYKRVGISNFTELGPLASRNTSQINVNTSAFSFQTVTGYKFNPLIFLGIGIGIDLYATQTFMPLFGSLRGDIYTKGAYIPYYFADLGYGFDITSYQNSPINGYGGLLYAVGGGLKINFNKASGFLLSLGYRIQNTSTTQNSTGLNTSTRYERIALRAGYYF